GRSAGLLRVWGNWLAPREVGDWLLEHPAVQEVAVVGVLGEHGLVKPHAFVVVREGREGLAEELRAFVREWLEPYKYPRGVTFLEALPRTHLGKVDRARLRKSTARFEPL